MSKRDLEYYQDEQKAFPTTHACRLTLAQAALVLEGLLLHLGVPTAKVILHRRVENFDRAHKGTRTIEFYSDYVTLASVVHEAAHLYFDDHDANHAFLTCLFLEVLKSKVKEDR